MDLIVATSRGLYCPKGDFYIDPWRPVERAIVTHGHGDHARPGSCAYLCHLDSAPILMRRLGEPTLQAVATLLAAPDEELQEEIVASLNASELARRKFCAIAQIAGLVSPAEPGASKGARQLQGSSSLFYDVFRRYDPGNELLLQAEREALEEELEIRRLRRELERMRERTLSIKPLSRCSPLAFPLIVERLRERLSNESLATRVERMTLQREKAAEDEPH